MSPRAAIGQASQLSPQFAGVEVLERLLDLSLSVHHHRPESFGRSHGKITWEVTWEDTIGGYQWRIPVEDTMRGYHWRIPWEDTIGGYHERIPLEDTQPVPIRIG
jgi:hypothetical protein